MRVLFLAVSVLLAVLPLEAEAANDSLTSLLEDLRSVESEMTANQQRIEALQGEIAQLQNLGKDAQTEIVRLQSLVADHAVRVSTLGDKYSQLLELAARQEAELGRAQERTWLLGGVAVVATLVALGEAVALAGRWR